MMLLLVLLVLQVPLQLCAVLFGVLPLPPAASAHKPTRFLFLYVTKWLFVSMRLVAIGLRCSPSFSKWPQRSAGAHACTSSGMSSGGDTDSKT